MHSDEVARRYGFRAALVPGVTVFAHMTRPVVAQWGEAWLAGGRAEVSFARPAYEGDLLTVAAMLAGDGAALDLTCANEAGEELARLRAGAAEDPAKADPRAWNPPAPPLTERQEATWELMRVGEPFPALAWQPTVEENGTWCEDVRDDLPLYREGREPCLHPGLILRQANNVLKNRFVLPAWIHTASRLTFHAAVRVGPAYEVRAIPEEKWARKGHEFVRLYVAVLGSGRVVAEILHTAIFRPRRAET
jgi:hypothetical protein